MQAACSSNEVMLYRVTRREVLRRLFASPKDEQARIVKVQWCTGYPGIVFGLDSLSRWSRPFESLNYIYINIFHLYSICLCNIPIMTDMNVCSVHLWDLCDDINTPIMSVPFRGKTITAMSLTSTPNSRNTYLVSVTF